METNLDHFYNQLEGCIKRVFPVTREGKRPIETEDELQVFLRVNSTRPDIEELQNAYESQNTKKMHRLTSQIRAENWHDFLGKVNRSNTRAIYAYLARVEGRNQMSVKPGDLAPILHNGELVTGHRERCAVIADYFKIRMAALRDGGTEQEPL